jgi:hypothetical protein
MAILGVEAVVEQETDLFNVTCQVFIVHADECALVERKKVSKYGNASWPMFALPSTSLSHEFEQPGQAPWELVNTLVGRLLQRPVQTSFLDVIMHTDSEVHEVLLVFLLELDERCDIEGLVWHNIDKLRAGGDGTWVCAPWLRTLCDDRRKLLDERG